jgi:hypothetical protein
MGDRGGWLKCEVEEMHLEQSKLLRVPLLVMSIASFPREDFEAANEVA